ncbi:MAG: molecular chaperone TorD family protein, partial [Pseudomonadota bacterium]
MPGAANDDAAGRSELARAAAGVFGLLGRVFETKPSADLVRAVRDRALIQSLEVFGAGLPDEVLEGGEEETAEALAREYTGLFVGPVPRVATYESLYRRGA